MDNPYPKTEKSVDLGGKPHYSIYNRDRWAFFELSGGELFWSGERIRWEYRATQKYLRDYLDGIARRYYRRYRSPVLPLAYLRLASKVANRWGWHTRAKLWCSGKHYVPYDNSWFDGDFCPVGDVVKFSASAIDSADTLTWIADDLEDPYARCDKCGSRLQIQKYSIKVEDSDRHDGREIWATGDVRTECSNKECRGVTAYLNDADAYMKMARPFRHKAKNLKIPLNRPTKAYLKAKTDQEKELIAAAAYLDFEARCHKKQEIVRRQKRLSR